MRAEWEYKKYLWKDVLTVINGKNQSAVASADGDYPIYGSGGVMGHANSYLCPENCVIIGRKGNINKPIFVQTKFWNVDTAFGLSAKEDVLLPRYLYYFCLDFNFEKLNKAVTIPSLTKADLLKIEIPLPPIPQQRLIVSELDKINSLIALKREQLKKYDELAQSLFYEMFGDPVENEKGWEVKKLGEIGTIVTGSTPPMKDTSNYSSNDYCFVKPSDLPSDGIGFLSSTEAYVSSKGFNLSRKLVAGSVLVSCIGSIGKIAILQREATCNQQINAIAPNSETESIYLAFAIMGIKSIMVEIANAPVVPIINKSTFSKFSIPLPPLSLQQTFAQQIEQIEEQKKQVTAAIAKLETLLASRMQYWFE